VAAGRIDRGLRVTFFKQNYVNALANGDVVATMAWSGDIYQENAIGAPEGMQFATPNDGGLLWTDNMVIPAGAQHPVDAITLMDFVYRPEIAAMITAFVAYVTPVPEARDVILANAAAATDPRTKDKLQVLADSPLVFLPRIRRRPCTRIASSRRIKSSRPGTTRSVASSPSGARRAGRRS
jgi:spermidine/putrescine transport system substrate-binding protein